MLNNEFKPINILKKIENEKMYMILKLKKEDSKNINNSENNIKKDDKNIKNYNNHIIYKFTYLVSFLLLKLSPKNYFFNLLFTLPNLII